MLINNKIIPWCLHGLFAILAIMAVLLFKERLYADAAYYAFHTVNKGWFHIEHGRTVLGLSQVLPLIGYYLGLPLKVLLVLWSLGHELFYYLLFLIILYPLKDLAGAFALLMVHLIGQLWLYYSPMYEICYGAALTVLFFSILNSGKWKDDKWMILMLLAQWFAMMSHPTNFLLVFMAMAWHYLENSWKKSIHPIITASFILGVVVEFLTLSDYEKFNINTPFDQGAGLKNLIEGEYWMQLSDFFLGYFPDLLLLMLIAAIYLLMKKNFLQLLLFLCSATIIFIAVNNKATTTVFIRYFESMYNPLVFIGVFAFCYGVFKPMNYKLKSFVSIGLLLLLGIRVYWIWDYGKPLQERMEQWERIVDNTQTLGGSKYVIEKANFEREDAATTWANPIEALLLSAMDGKDQSISLITESDLDFANNRRELTDSTFLFRRFEIKEEAFLNERFFILKEGPYNSLNSNHEVSNWDELKSSIQIRPYEKEKNMVFHANDTSEVLIKLSNQHSDPIPSNLKHAIYLSYHWYQNDELVEWEGIRNTLEMDVWHEHVQNIRIHAPSSPGDYQIQFDVVLEGKMWFELAEKYAVTVN